MSELKPCPFCGGTKICTEKGINLIYCDNCSAESNVEHWNTRPIEDALNARIAELEAVIEILEDQQREAKNILIDKKLHIDSLYEEGFKLQQRIAELKESDKHWAGNVKVCMQLIERYESDIAELEEIDRMRSEIVSTLNQANANNEDEIELLKKRIAKLKEKNETLKTACDILSGDNNLLFKRLMSIETPDDLQTSTIVYGKERD